MEAKDLSSFMITSLTPPCPCAQDETALNRFIAEGLKSSDYVVIVFRWNHAGLLNLLDRFNILTDPQPELRVHLSNTASELRVHPMEKMVLDFILQGVTGSYKRHRNAAVACHDVTTVKEITYNVSMLGHERVFKSALWVVGPQILPIGKVFLCSQSGVKSAITFKAVADRSSRLWST